MIDTKNIDIETDPAALELVHRYRRMSKAELLEDILRHEKEHRGIDWRALFAQGAPGRAEARRLAHQHLRRLCSELEDAGIEVPELTRRVTAVGSDDVQPMPEWAIDRAEADKWVNAVGDGLGDMVLYRLKVLQALELSSGTAAWTTLTASIGVLAWMKRGYDFYKAARIAGLARLAAIADGIKNVTVAATRVFVATVIIAVIAEILFFLSQKEAVVYMVLVNLTDDTLELKDIVLARGKQTVQFEEPLEQKKALLPRDHIPGLGPEDDSFWIGLFSAQKRDGALIGTRGAFNLQPSGGLFPSRVFVGWEIPLSGLFGGPNRCLTSATFTGNVDEFADKTQNEGSLQSESANGNGRVRARMHSGSGSEGYMSVVFYPA